MDWWSNGIETYAFFRADFGLSSDCRSFVNLQSKIDNSRQGMDIL
jgi:hypothetical protein